MQIKLLTLAFAAVAFAAPSELVERAPLCPSLDTPQCCQLDVDGVAGLTCASCTQSPSFHVRLMVKVLIKINSIRLSQDQEGVHGGLRCNWRNSLLLHSRSCKYSLA